MHIGLSVCVCVRIQVNVCVLVDDHGFLEPPKSSLLSLCQSAYASLSIRMPDSGSLIVSLSETLPSCQLVCPFVSQPHCHSICLSVCLSVCLPNVLSPCLHLYICLYGSLCLSACMFVSLSFRPSICWPGSYWFCVCFRIR